ncbi:MAG: hypothetical protein AAFY59_05425 [Pseudomonadota bacterium]
MATYKAVLMHGERGGEGAYTFDGPEDLFARSPVKIMRAFMDSVELERSIGHIDYEINAAMKNKRGDIVTVIGELSFETGDPQPFAAMINPA